MWFSVAFCSCSGIRGCFRLRPRSRRMNRVLLIAAFAFCAAIAVAQQTATTEIASAKPTADKRTVTEAVSYQGRVIIPVASTVHGEVLRTNSPRRIKGKPMIDLHPASVMLPSGESYLISATVVDTGNPKFLDVNEEGQIRGPGHSRDDLVIGGIGTG